VTAPFTVATDAAGLTAGIVVMANGVVGSFNVTATAAGAATPMVFSLDNTKLQPTVALAISSNPAPYDAVLTLTATVTTTLGAALDPITGSVIFTDATNAINLSSALAAGSAVVGANPLPAGTYTVTATYGGDNGHLAAVATAVVQVLPPPAPPHARADVAAVLQDTPLLLDVLANDVAGTSQQLTVYTVTQPLVGGVAAIELNQVRFTPAAGFTGLVTFTYTIQDGNSLESTTAVTVRITAAAGHDLYLWRPRLHAPAVHQRPAAGALHVQRADLCHPLLRPCRRDRHQQARPVLLRRRPPGVG